MQGRHQPPTITPPATAADPLRRIGAVTWISREQALVGRRTAGGWVDVATVHADAPDDPQTYLARVAHEIGDAEKVMIIGPDTLRTELEREYVTIYHRPERLLDVAHVETLTEDELVERLRGLG
jgi:hypothetical protein